MKSARDRLIAACLAGFVAVGVGAEASADPEAIARASTSVVALLPDWPNRAARREEPEGSAVAIGDGTVLITADHVLGQAKSARIRLADGSIADVAIVARDQETDVAFLKAPQPLPPMQMGGDPLPATQACAIGNAFGLGVSISCGVVSAVARGGVGFNDIEDFVQTDAAVNPGSSGGALVDGDGRLIGMLSAIFTKANDGDLGVNFAVSAPLLASLIARLDEGGRIDRLSLGVSLRRGRADGSPVGLEILALQPDGLGERSGLLPGDRVLAVDGIPVQTLAAFRGRLERAKDAAELAVLRGTERVSVRVKKSGESK